ncbi:uncharacterized protein DUF3943 [Mucilaginibacter yixingensis]|uniref:Uncharacterized protein DUF3943 n=1 Tax=Mucilaginibacter yixingensis TaxID=1295612 RepID=A0A2T5JGU0_9SPHI|nr:DUF3943 domain-containing protein [Mucilaginibacter yixingensis]PTR01621.1 uncharacterized protein DUF3943 [Mucilaginibacter yixingensis]
MNPFQPKQLIVFLLPAVLILVKPCTGLAQTPLDGHVIMADTVSRGSTDPKTRDRTKHFGRAAFEWGLAETVPWALDRYVRKADYAYISGKTIAHNLKPSSWEWDNDEFQTNQFGHPYHGSLFFSAMRTNGYSFWQSAPAAFLGSYVWESYAENQNPAPNDLINTTFGGIVLGEMTYRLSNKIVNNRQTGFKRQISEVAGFLINPMNGLTRIMDGRWGRVSIRNPVDHDSSKVVAWFDGGIRRFDGNNSNVITHGKFGWYGRVRLIYGTPYDNYRTPFSNLYINAEFGSDDSSKLNNVSVYGSLAGWKLRMNDRVRELAVLSANYDYFHNDAFSYGGQSVRINIFSEIKLPKSLLLNLNVGGGGILLAAVPDSYHYRGRSYDYGSGAGLNFGGGLNWKEKVYCGINYAGAWIVTINGNQSHYFLHTVTSEVRYSFSNILSVAAEPGFFSLKGYYNNYPDVDKRYPFLRISARYTISNQ